MLSPATPTWRRVAEGALWVLIAIGAAWLAVRLLGLERGFPLVPLLAYTPYVPVAGILVVLLAALLRRRLAVAAAALLVAAFTALVLPRAIPGQDAERSDGPSLTVLTANLHFGDGDTNELVELVRTGGVELLSVQELTPESQRRLADAGLEDVLPHSALDAAENASGSALYSRYPLRDIELTVGEGGFAMPQADLAVPGGPAVEVMAIHAPPPMGASQVADWERDLSSLPRAEPNGPIRLLAGDFNATLDHAELRELIGSGYTDAADATGSGLVHTWPRPMSPQSLPVTIDHVLVDERVYVEDVSVHDFDSSDHRMLLAELILPPGPVRL